MARLTEVIMSLQRRCHTGLCSCPSVVERTDFERGFTKA